MRIPHLLVDMDDVLVDFRSGACALHSRIREGIDAACISTGIWRMAGQMGLSDDEFWKPINEAGEAFWVGLKKLPWYSVLMEVVLSVADEYHIVTSPSQCPGSYSGKVKWLNNLYGLGYSNRHLIPTPNKHLFANIPGVVLIDDREETILKFGAKGGKGILFPSCGNRLHSLRHNPVQYVVEQILAISKESQCTAASPM